MLDDNFLHFELCSPIFIVVAAEQQLHSGGAARFVGQQQLNGFFEPFAPTAVVACRGGSIKPIETSRNFQNLRPQWQKFLLQHGVSRSLA